MLELTVKQILASTNGKLLNEKIIDKKITSIVTDSRRVTKGSLFVCIEGEKFDGHDFCQDAFNSGAVACLVHKSIDGGNTNIIQVENTLTAYGDIASFYRNFYEEKLGKPLIVVGVTGSVGKTSTKDYIFEVLSKKFRTLKSKLNENNEIGLPKTILNLVEEEAIVVEMGMRGLNQIEYLSRIARPTHAVITNIGSNHLEFLGTKDNILKAKSEITIGMAGDGVLVVNGDDEYLKQGDFGDVAVFKVGFDEDNYMRVIDYDTSNSIYVFTDESGKEYTVSLKLKGKHNVYNSLVAICIAKCLGVPVEEAVSACESYTGDSIRQNIFTLKNRNVTIIDDAYNASYESMKASLEVLESFENRKVAVLGDMLELGEYSDEYHYKVGKLCVEKGVDIVIACGKYSRNIVEAVMESMLDNMENKKVCYAYYTQDAKEAAQKLMLMLQEGDCVLVKGSNAMKMGHVVEYLRESDVGI